jgi:hypothetical protein
MGSFAEIRTDVLFRARCARANFTVGGERLMAIVNNFAACQFTREEFVLLKATVLMNAGKLTSTFIIFKNE